ncbi:MAG: nucleoside triphosphate pyrophosphatase [Myxococcota bacterium]|nr:nucleoside triphosphate pyrophosphatase [Myxococcota bacterium]
MAPPLVLASTSVSRQRLLARLGLPFVSERPAVDETRLPGESPAQLVQRLARAKAEAVSQRHPAALVLGGDQVAVLDDEILTKPGTPAQAVRQLSLLQGRTHQLLTAIALVRRDAGFLREALDVTELTMRPWREAELAAYVQHDAPLDCAGSYRLEGLGIALFSRWQGVDPSAVEGLPLTILAAWFAEGGLPLFGPG